MRYKEEIKRVKERIEEVLDEKTELDWKVHYLNSELKDLNEKLEIMDRVDKDLNRLEIIDRKVKMRNKKEDTK